MILGSAFCWDVLLLWGFREFLGDHGGLVAFTHGLKIQDLKVWRLIVRNSMDFRSFDSYIIWDFGGFGGFVVAHRVAQLVVGFEAPVAVMWQKVGLFRAL